MTSSAPFDVPPSADRIAWRCRWLFPGDGEPIAGGVIEIEHGRITAIHDRPGGDAVDLGNVALIPGLVNAHTHLEFSTLTTPIGPAQPFTTWIRQVIADRRMRRGVGGSADESRAIAAGVLESRAGGVTSLGEIATSDVWEVPEAVFKIVDSLRESNRLAERADHPWDASPRIVAFREIIGLLPERAEEQLAIAARHLKSARSSNITPGLSPHAPYSVHVDLLRRLVDLAVAHRALVAMHLAETESELELLEHGTGEFRTMLEEFGLWRDGLISPGSRPLDFLKELARTERALVIHGNYLSQVEQEFLTQHPHLSVVYCPRTHAYFGHRAHPWRDLLARGVNVALGTDSRASNPDLSLWREVQFLREQFPDVEPWRLLDLATRNGARALGLDAMTGSLTPGKAADFAVVALPEQEGDPWSLLFHPDSKIAPLSDR